MIKRCSQLIEPLIPAAILPLLIQLAKGYDSPACSFGGAIGAYMTEKHPLRRKKPISEAKGRGADPILAGLKQSLEKPAEPKAVEFDLDKEYKNER